MRTRIVFLFLMIGFLWLSLVIRAGQLQIFSPEKLSALKQKQFHTVVNLHSRRGDILDRNGRPLAFSITAYSLYADPSIVKINKKQLRAAAKLLREHPKHLAARIGDKKKRFVWLSRMLPEEQMLAIRKLKIYGFGFVEEWKRVYPNDSLFGHSLGFLGSEGSGLEGLELQFEDWLQSNNLRVQVKKDARGRPLMSEGLLFTENPDGEDLQLTIDSEYQYLLESELKRAKIEFNADGASGIIVDARTAEIRAMASEPGFDPNHPRKASVSARRNRILTDPFEPGSVMKPFVVASGLKSRVITPRTRIFGENGKFKVNDRTIREAESHHSFGMMTLTELISESSNIGAAKIALDIGDERLREDLTSFGFGEKTRVELPGESRGVLPATPWIDHHLANIGFGHGFSATPLQIAAGYTMLANRGMMRNLSLVKSASLKVHAQMQNLLKKSNSADLQILGTISETRALSAEMTEEVVELLKATTTLPRGTGGLARIPPFVVAGKTGTAQRVIPGTRGYAKDTYIASFAGFFPADNPRFVIYVAVDTPRTEYYASKVAAPVFARIGKGLIIKEGLVPTDLAKSNPGTGNKETEMSKMMAQQKAFAGLDLRTKKIGPFDRGTHLKQAIENEFVPEWTDLTLREVLREARDAKIQVQVRGQGVVASTSPSAFEPLPSGKRVTIILREKE